MSTYYKTFPRQISLEEIAAFAEGDVTIQLEETKCGSPVLIMKNDDHSRPNEFNWLHLVVNEEGVVTDLFRNGWSNPTNLINYLSYMLNVIFIAEYEDSYHDLE